MISSLFQGEAKDPAEEAREKHEAKLKQAQDANGAFQEITEDVLNEIFSGESWRRRGFQHLTFRSEAFNLKTLQGLLLQPIDLTFLQSLDASENSLTELDCVAGTSRKLKTAGVPQGILVFGSLQVLKLKKNLLTSFSLKLLALRELDLSYNRLEVLPMLQILPKLEVLLLDHNKISGPLTEVNNSLALKKLDLSHNQFMYSAVELNQQLQNLLNFDNLALKLKDNPFCATIPAYQILCLQKLPQLRKLDDIQSSDMEKQRQAACSVSLNLRAIDESASRHESLKVADESGGSKAAMSAVFRPANKKTVFRDISEYFARALKDEESTQICIAGATRLTHTMSQCHKVDMDNLREELSQGRESAAERIAELLEDIKTLAQKVTGPNQKILIYRAVAKMSVIPEHGIGEECMRLLRNLTELNPSLEETVIGMLQELIIYPLKHEYGTSRDHRSERVFSYVRILSNFDSPKFGAALKPITEELGEMYCKMVLEATDYTYIALLIEKWSSSVENLKDEPQVAGFFTSSNWPGYYEILAMMLQLIDLETAKLQSSDQKDIDAFEGYEVVATLNMAINMLRSSEHKIVKVFVAWSPGKPAFYMRIMQKIMLMFGHNKKADARPSIKTLTDATERILAKLYDVMGALMELPDSGSLVQEIIEGHDFRGQLMKYMNCVLEDDDHRPIAMAGALRLALVILKSYQHREDPPGEAISSQVITALNEMRSLVDCLSMKGPTFDNLWQVCGGDEVPPRARELTHPVVLENFEAIVKLVSFFSQQEGPLYAESRRVVGGNREELMFQLITVPNAKLKDAALQCLSSASVADTSASEMESLIGLLDVKGQELQSSFTYLERIMSQLNKMLTAQSGYGALSLRTTHAKTALEVVLRLFVRTSQCNPDPEFFTVRVHLLQACLRFLKTAGRNLQDWRQHHLRTKNVAQSVLTALQCEDRFTLDMPDISVERTWTGRSVETLLQCFSGLDRVRARYKVALRVLCRMADVLDGHSDFQDANGSTEDQEAEEDLHLRLMEEEAKPWDEEKMRKNLAYLDNMEEEDRRVQQEIFTSANGAQRLEMFLGGLYNSQTNAKTQARVSEAALIQEGIKLVEDSKISAAESDSEDGFDSRSESSSSEPDGVRTEAAVIDMPPREFSGQRQDLMAFEDLRQSFAGKFQTAFSILFTARWDSFNHWSSIIDFGNGPTQENIVIANQGRLNSLVFEIYRGGQRFTVVCPAVLTLNETCTYLCTVSEDGVMCIQCKGEIIGQCTGLPSGGGHSRKYLYVGKSCWPDRNMFHGRVQQLKVFNGQTLDWHEVVDTVFEEGEDGFDRPFLMKELLSHKQTTAKIEPKVHGADVFRATEKQDQSFEPSGQIDPGYFVAALLRCCFGVLHAPASGKAEAEMVNALLDKHLVVRLVSLVRMCGPFNCCCGIKFFQLMGTVLQSRSSNPDVEMLVTCNILMSYATSVVEDAVKALQGDPEQKILGRLLSEEMAKLCSVVCGSLPYLQFADEDKQFHQKFVECCLDEMVPPKLVHSFVQMALYCHQGNDTPSPIEEDVRNLLVKIIERCPSRQRDTWQVLCSTLLTGEVDKGQEWLSDFTDAVQKSAAQRILEEQQAAKAFGSQKITFEDSHPERALCTFNAEVMVFNQRLSVSRIQHGSFLNFVVTNKAVRIVDTSVVGYPAEDPGQIKDCEWKLKDLVRITRGFLPQGLFLGVRRQIEEEGRDVEGIVAVVFHRARDRDAALGKLQHLKLLPVDDDRLLDEVLSAEVKDDILLAVHSPPEYGFFLTDSAFKLYILTKAAIHDFVVDFTQWRPKSSEELEDSTRFKISPEIKAIRDATVRENPELADSAQQPLLSKIAEARPFQALEKVSFFPEAWPRMEMSFQEHEDLSISFFDESTKERWREEVLELLAALDPSGNGWSKQVRGETVPLKQ